MKLSRLPFCHYFRKLFVCKVFRILVCLSLFTHTSYSQASSGGSSGGGGGSGSVYGFKYIIYPSKEAVPNKFIPRNIASIKHNFSKLFLGRGGSRVKPDTLDLSTAKGKATVVALSTLIDSNATKPLLQNINNINLLTSELALRQRSDSLTGRIHSLNDSLAIYFKQLRDTVSERDKSLVFFKFSYGIDTIYYTVNSLPVMKDSIDASSSFQMPTCCGVKHDSVVTIVIYKKMRVLNPSQPTTVSKSLTEFLLEDKTHGGRYHNKLKVYISALSKQTDSMTFKLWDSKRIRRIRPRFLNVSKDSVYRTDYTVKSPWNETVGPHRKMVIPFETKYLMPVNLPFLYDFNTHSVSVSFLNAGLAYGWAFGRTKFYEYNQMPPRNAYFGGGPLFNLSSSLTASSSSSTASTTFAKMVLGGHLGYSTGSLQFLIAGGWYYDVGGKQVFAIHSKVVLGFGFGLSLFNFAVPSSTGQGGSAGH
jgi:hypothetical protein